MMPASVCILTKIVRSVLTGMISSLVILIGRPRIDQRAGRRRGRLRSAEQPLARQEAGHASGDVPEPLTSRNGPDHWTALRLDRARRSRRPATGDVPVAHQPARPCSSHSTTRSPRESSLNRPLAPKPSRGTSPKRAHLMRSGGEPVVSASAGSSSQVECRHATTSLSRGIRNGGRWRRPVGSTWQRCRRGRPRHSTPNALVINPVPGFELSPYLYMQFMEPLGATDGSVEAAWDHLAEQWRDDVVAVTKELAPPMMRWGGIFADFYRWREGVGPREARPAMVNLLWGGVESNQIGTGEFVDFCRRVGADPLICVNFESDGRQQYTRYRNSVRTADAKEAAAWVSYCNDPVECGAQGTRHRRAARRPALADRQRNVLRQEWLRPRDRGAKDRGVRQGHAGCGSRHSD